MTPPDRHPQRRDRRGLCLALVLSPVVANLHAMTPTESAIPSTFQAVGQTTLRFLGFKIYDARLLAPQGAALDAFEQHPFALELTYARRLEGKLIAERSLIEMRRIGNFSDAQAQRWMAWMQQAFPDVNTGDRLTGVHAGKGRCRFFHNAQLRGEFDDATFTRLFFGIWLHPDTSQPLLRLELLGQKAA